MSDILKEVVALTKYRYVYSTIYLQLPEYKNVGIGAEAAKAGRGGGSGQIRVRDGPMSQVRAAKKCVNRAKFNAGNGWQMYSFGKCCGVGADLFF